MSSFLVALGCNVYDPILGEPLADGGNEGGWMLNPKGTVGTGGSSGGSGGIASASVSSSSATTSATGGTGIDSGHEGDSGAGGQQGGAGGEGGTAGTGGAVAVGGAGGAGGQAGTGGAAGSGMAGAPDAGTEAGAMGCPTSVVLSGEFATSMHGGADATDMLFKDACPQGGPVIGYTGSVDSRAPASIGRIATICGKLAVVSTPNGCQITVSSGSTLPLRGQYGDSPFTQRCPTNQVVVGMRGRAGVYLDQASFVCAPLVVSSGPMGYSLSIGATTVLTPAGGTGGSAFQDGCPAGQIARGSNVTVVSGIVDAMGLVCGTPSLTGP